MVARVVTEALARELNVLVTQLETLGEGGAGREWLARVVQTDCCLLKRLEFTADT